MTTRSVKEKKRYEEEKKKIHKTIKWDKTSIIILILFILSVLSFIVALNLDFKGYHVKGNSNWATTCGEIVFVKTINNMEQTKVGNRFVIVGYIVKYNYEVTGIRYQDSIFLLSRAIKNKLLVNNIREGDLRKVFYNKFNYKESHLDTDLESTCE